MSNEIFKKLRDKAFQLLAEAGIEAFVRGLWVMRFCCRPALNERVFNGYMVIAQSTGQGSCLCNYKPKVDFRILGNNVRTLISTPDPISIALLDSIYNSFYNPPLNTFVLSGDPRKKAEERATIIADEAVSLLSQPNPPYRKALLIGFVATIAKKLKQLGFAVSATDLTKDIVGREYHGIVVESSVNNNKYIAESQIAIITGMTLQTQTIDTILKVAMQNDTKVIIFAQTGASLSREYLEFGANIVVSEPFPIYDFHGQSEIWVYKDTC